MLLTERQTLAMPSAATSILPATVTKPRKTSEPTKDLNPEGSPRPTIVRISPKSGLSAAKLPRRSPSRATKGTSARQTATAEMTRTPAAPATPSAGIGPPPKTASGTSAAWTRHPMKLARNTGIDRPCPRKRQESAAAKSGSDSAAIQTPWAKNAAARAPLPAPWNCATKTVAYEAVAVMRTAKVPASVPPVSEAPAAAGE